MKQYLMTGIAALVLSAGFTSCSHDTDFEQITPEQQVVQEYNFKFEQYIGGKAKNPNWGFTSANKARTRALSDKETGANKNRNEWAATDKDFNLLVPTPLSDRQKLRVKAYFQAHRYLTWTQPKMTNYFVQQVYTGDPTTAGALSPEQYTQGNNTPVVGSKAMNHLMIGGEHVLDFNGGDNPNTAFDVLDNGQPEGGSKHSDQITLMIGVTPTYVGYLDSEGSVLHNDCMALAGAKAIDDWANDPQNYVNGAAIGANVWYGKDELGYDNSSWDRSFVGMDFEQRKLDELFVTRWDGSEYPTVKSFATITYNTAKLNGKFVNYSEIQDTILKFPNGENVRWISDNVNQYLATALNTNNDTFNKSDSEHGQYYDVDALLDVISQGAYPKQNNSEFFKAIGGRDYVFSDWIVTLSPALPAPTVIEETEDPDLRIMAEDLSVNDESDFDFNDVVFDVYFAKEGKSARIQILAAGGTLPITVDGNEAHAALGISNSGIMINTKGTDSDQTEAVQRISMDGVAYSNLIDLKGDLAGITTAEQAKDIKIIVTKDGHTYELTAEPGDPAKKIAVAAGTKWMKERKSIKEVSNFAAWAKNEVSTLTWSSENNRTN